MPQPNTRSTGLRWSNWNLLLAIPLLMLFTPVFNREGPHLFGIPFFYWYQMAFVLVGVVCVGVVYLKTKNVSTEAPTGPTPDGDRGTDEPGEITR